MNDKLHEPDDRGDVVDQTEADLTAGPASVRPQGAAPVDTEGHPAGHPSSTAPAGTPGEATSRGGVGPAGPGSTTTGVGSGTGVDPDEEDVPPTAPG